MKFCQSCGMPMKKEEDFGTEKDGSRSEEYCSLCYANGAFLANCTLEEMQAMAKKGMEEKKLPKLLIWWSLRSMPKLKRWRKQ